MPLDIPSSLLHYCCTWTSLTRLFTFLWHYPHRYRHRTLSGDLPLNARTFLIQHVHLYVIIRLVSLSLSHNIKIFSPVFVVFISLSPFTTKKPCLSKTFLFLFLFAFFNYAFLFTFDTEKSAKNSFNLSASIITWCDWFQGFVTLNILFPFSSSNGITLYSCDE